MSIEIYKITSSFPKSETYALSSQLQRASTSIPANIAEGFGRKGDKEFIQFLYQAKGSLYETQNFLFIIQKLNYIDQTQFKILFEKYEILAKMLNSFISKVKQND